MRSYQISKFFLEFKGKSSLIYRKIKEVLYDFKNDSIIYFDHVDNIVGVILSQYNLIERQILIKNFLFELDPILVNNFEIFPNNSIQKLKKIDSCKNQTKNREFFHPNNTTLDVLNQIGKSEGIINLYD